MTDAACSRVAANGTGNGVNTRVWKSWLCCLLAVETSRLCHGGRKSKLSQSSVTNVKCILCVVRFSNCCRLTAVASLGVYVLGAEESLVNGFYMDFT